MRKFELLGIPPLILNHLIISKLNGYLNGQKSKRITQIKYFKRLNYFFQ